MDTPTAVRENAVRNSRRSWVIAGISMLVIASVCGGLIYWMSTSNQVSVDASSIAAPEIDLAASQPGILQEVYVQTGDEVSANETVARVGNELIKTKVAGIIVSTATTIGKQVNPSDTVVSMIDPTQLRVVGKVDENKGLSRISVGDPVVFTVDAFGSRKFSGVIDEVTPTSNQSGIVFNISSQRETQQFDVKARFDTAANPELKNGMSARMTIYTQ